MPEATKLHRDSPLDATAGAIVRLGDKTYPVVPQKIGYLRSKLGVALGALGDFDTDSSDAFVGSLGDQGWNLLKVFIPNLMPVHEFMGYGTKKAMEENEYDEHNDPSPSFDQIVAAFQAVLEVNKLDLFKHLGKMLDPQLIRATLNQAWASVAEDRLLPTTSSESTSAPTGPDTPTP